MNITILRVGRGRTRWADEAANDYRARLGKRIRTEEKTLRPASGPERKARQEEADKLLAQLGPGDRLVVLDERGDRVDSDGFAQLLNAAAAEGAKRIVFAIGGPYGRSSG